MIDMDSRYIVAIKIIYENNHIFYKQLSIFAPPKSSNSKILILAKKKSLKIFLSIMNISTNWQFSNFIINNVPDLPHLE